MLPIYVITYEIFIIKRFNTIISREKGFASHQLSISKLVLNGDQLISVSDDKRIIIWDIKFDAV